MASPAEAQPRFAWWSLAALCYVAIMFGGCVKSVGILYVQFLEIYQQGTVVTSLLPTIFLVSLTIGTMTGGALSDRLALRTILFVAGVVCAVGYVTAAFAPNFIVVLLGCGLISGFGIGLITSTPASTLVTLFRKKRHLAIGIYFCFSSIGSTVMPLFYGLLITYIKVRGMLLVTAGMWLILFVIGLIVKPSKIKEVQEIIRNPSYVKRQSDKEVNCPTTQKQSHVCKAINLSQNGTKQSDVCEDTNFSQKGTTRADNCINADESNIQKGEVKGEVNAGFICDCEQRNQENSQCADINSKNQTPSNPETGQGRTIAEENSLPTQQKEGKLKQILQAVRNCKFWLIIIIISFSQMGNFVALYQLPSFAKEKGQHLTGITLVVSTFGICDLIGRICFGYLGDKKACNRFAILTCCQLVAGGGVLAMTFVPHVSAPYLISVVLGLCGGIHVVYTAPLVTEIVPTKVTGTANGIAFMCMFLCTAAIQTPAGLLQTISGTYASGIQMASGFYLAAALVTAPMGLAFFFRKCTSKGYTL